MVQNGIKRNAFYLRAPREKNINSLVRLKIGNREKIFDYRENEDGKIVIVDNRNKKPCY